MEKKLFVLLIANQKKEIALFILAEETGITMPTSFTGDMSKPEGETVCIFQP